MAERCNLDLVQKKKKKLKNGKAGEPSRAKMAEPYTPDLVQKILFPFRLYNNLSRNAKLVAASMMSIFKFNNLGVSTKWRSDRPCECI